MSAPRLGEPPESTARTHATVSRLAGAAAAAIGAGALVGWALDITVLKSLHPSLVAMKANAALALLLVGSALAIGRGGALRTAAATLLASGCIAIGVLSLAEHVSGMDLGIDRVPFPVPPDGLTGPPGRLSVLGAVGFLLLGLAAALGVAARRPLRLARWAATFTFGLGLLGVVGYARGVGLWYGSDAPTPVSLHGAAAIALASAAALLARADGGIAALLLRSGPGGMIARRLLPLTLVVPVALDLAVSWLPVPGAVEGALHALAVTAVLALVVSLLATRVEEADEAQRGMIAERERREREALQQLETLRHLGTDAAILLGDDGAILQANERAVQVYGYSEAELLRLRIQDLRPPETRADLLRRKEQISALGGATYETLHRRRDGSTFPVEVSARKMDLGGKCMFQTIVRDLTAERAGRAAVEYQAMLLESLHDAVIGTDAELRITAWNPAAERVLGWTRAEALQLRLPDVVASDAAAVSALQAAVAATGACGSSRFECRARRSGGAPVDLDATLVVLAGEADAGGVRGYVVVTRDVSERKRAEAELQRTQETLLHSQKMDAVGRLASGIAHDFNNLLAVIQSCSRSLRDALPEGETREDAEEIWQAGDRGAQLVRKLLAFARKSPTSPVPTDACAVIREFEKLMRRTVGEDVSITLSLAERPWLTRIDPRDLEQALMNLVVNAREAMPGGGEIRIRAAPVELSRPPPGCDELAPGPYVQITVADTGNGIAPSLLPRVFEPFFTTKHANGAGLGLATVSSIVRGAGGRIAVASDPGRGATFDLYLPACDAAAEQAEPARAPAPAPRTISRALLVEDDAAVRRATRRMLERGEMKVLEAANAVEALRLLREEGASVDVVVSDVVMPDVQGTDLAMVLAELHPGLPVVLVSGYAAGHEDALARTVLSKPFTQEELFERIHEALGRRPRAPGASPRAEERRHAAR